MQSLVWKMCYLCFCWLKDTKRNVHLCANVKEERDSLNIRIMTAKQPEKLKRSNRSHFEHSFSNILMSFV